MIIGVVCQEKTLGYTMHKLHIQMPRFLNERSWRPITLTELTTRSISFQEQVLNFHTTFLNVNCLNAKLNLHFSDVFALLHCQCRDAGDSIRLQALKHGEGAAAGTWASAQGWCDQDEKQHHNRGHLTVSHGGGSSEFVILGETPPCSRNSGCEEKRLFSWPALRVMIPSRSWAIELCSRAQGNSGLLPPLLLSLPPSPRWRNGGEGQSSPLVECECEMRESSGHQTPLWHSQKWAGKTNPWAAGGHGWIGSAPPVRADRELFQIFEFILRSLKFDFRL